MPLVALAALAACSSDKSPTAPNIATTAFASSLGYGSSAYLGIPGNSILVFSVTLVSAQ